MTEAPRVTFDADHGGRWISLLGAGREWLWRNPDSAVQQARLCVRPGDAFVDAGGGEECCPTVRGVPDHGDVWSRRWQVDGETMSVDASDVHLTRRACREGDALVVDFALTAAPGARLVHATHLLLELSPSARVIVDEGVRFRAADADQWHGWPIARGADQSRLGPDDGSAECWVLPGVTRCRLDDGESLELIWERTDSASPSQDLGLMIWRNLRGWPEDAPYRSIGIEPFFGQGSDWSVPGEGGQVDAGGHANWRLTIRAGR